MAPRVWHHMALAMTKIEQLKTETITITTDLITYYYLRKQTEK